MNVTIPDTSPITSLTKLIKYVHEVRKSDKDQRPNLESTGTSDRTNGTVVCITLYGGPSTSPAREFNISIVMNWRGACQVQYGMNDSICTTESFMQDVRPVASRVLAKCDVDSLFNELFRGAMVQMVARMPVYAVILNKFRLVKDLRCDTLYVTFSPIMLSYEIHYNPRFIVETMIAHLIYMSYSGCVNVFSNNRDEQFISELESYTALMVSHEMQHVLRANLGAGGKQSEVTADVDHELANLIEDSVINQNLSSIFMKTPMTCGITDKVTMSFNVGKRFLNKGDKGFIELVVDAFNQSFSALKVSGWDKRSANIIRGEMGKVQFVLNRKVLEDYKENSNELSRDIGKFMKAISATVSMDDIGKMLKGALEDIMKAQGSGGSPIKMDGVKNPIGKAPDNSGAQSTTGGSDDGSNSQGGSSSGGQDLEDDSRNGNPSSSSGSSSGGQGGRGGSSGSGDDSNVMQTDEGLVGTSSKSLDSLSSEEAELASKVVQQIAETSDAPVLSEKEGEKVQKIQSVLNENQKERIQNLKSQMSSSVLSKVTTGSTVSSWKKVFGRMLANCLGIKEVYSNEVPSARIEGAFGREEEVPSLKRLLISLDCSGSMGPEQFQKALKEIETITKALKSKEIEVWVVYWGTEEYLYKTKGTQGLLSKIRANSKSCGGTNFNKACEYMASKTPKFDAMVVMTDGYFDGKASPKAKAFISKNKRKLMWVVTPGHTTSYIESYDSGFKNRLVKQK